MLWQDRWCGKETQHFHESLLGAVAPVSRRGNPPHPPPHRPPWYQAWGSSSFVSFLDKTAGPWSLGTAVQAVVVWCPANSLAQCVDNRRKVLCKHAWNEQRHQLKIHRLGRNCVHKQDKLPPRIPACKADLGETKQMTRPSKSFLVSHAVRKLACL